MSGWRPAALNISGTPLETPRPTRNSPASAAAGSPISSIAPSGMPVSSAPQRSSATAPMRRLIQSPTRRPAVMPAVKNEYASAASAALAPRSRRR